MTAKRRLVPLKEVREALDFLKEYGVKIGAVDIRSDGVTVYPPTKTPGNAVDDWFQKDADRAGPAPSR